MDKRKTILGGIAMLIWLLLTGCAGYYDGYGYYDNSYYDDYGYGYFVYPYDRHHRGSGEHHREFGHGPAWGEHQGGGERRGGSEHHGGDEHHGGGEHRH